MDEIKADTGTLDQNGVNGEYLHWLLTEYVPICGGADPPADTTVVDPPAPPAEITPPETEVIDEVEVPGREGKWVSLDNFKRVRDQHETTVRERDDLTERLTDVQAQLEDSNLSRAEVEKWQSAIEAVKKDPSLLDEALAELGIKRPVKPDGQPADKQPATGLDPKFMSRFEKMEGFMTNIEKQAETKKIVQEFDRQVTGLLTQNSIPEEKRKLYYKLIRTEVRDQNAGFADLKRIFRDVHTELSGLTTGQVNKYVKDKSGANVPPSQTTGGQPPAPKEVIPKNSEERVELIKSILRSSKGGE